MHLDGRIVDEAGRPTTNLLMLLSDLGMDHDGSLGSIVAVTQKQLFQRSEDGRAKERWELEEITTPGQSGAGSDTGFRERCLESLRQLGMIDEVLPCQSSYDYGLLLGALVTRVRSRLAHLIYLWTNGCRAKGIEHVRFRSIVMLSGERRLLPQSESMTGLVDANNGILPFRDGWRFTGPEPQTELDMMRLIWDQSFMPDEMRDNVQVVCVNAKAKPGAQRPSTEDTVIAWNDTDPAPGSCLAISNQPHVRYQNAVIQTSLRRGFSLETIGAAASRDHKLAFYLRELAGSLRQVEILRNTAK